MQMVEFFLVIFDGSYMSCLSVPFRTQESVLQESQKGWQTLIDMTLPTVPVGRLPKLWSPFTLTSAPYAVILLNQPIQINFTSFQTLWDAATFRICVDGGTNQLFDLTRNNVRDLLTPDLITGDFDSISPSVRTHYEELGARTVETLDQNFTDFTKALHEFFAGIGRNDYPAVNSVLVINEPSGRHDQFFANISTLCKFRESEIPVFIVSEQSLSWILCQGPHRLKLGREYVEQHPFCGLIPLHGKTKIKTDGLRWNLDQSMECSFAQNGMVSTSNEIAAETLDIDTDQDILWTMKSF